MARRRSKPGPIPDDETTVVDGPPVRPTGRADPAALPRIEVPPQAARILGGGHPGDDPDPDTAPRVGGYALVARFPSSASADVFLGYKMTPFGALRRAVVKWVDGRRADRALAAVTLRDEARALSALDHPNVVSIYDHDEDPDGAHLAVEYVAGTDLRRVLAELARRGDRLPFTLSAFLVAEVLRGLEHVQAARGPGGDLLDIVHRDVNPSNVLLGEDGRVKLTDFGAVRMLGRGQADTAPGMVKGKVRYLAPEYIASQRCTRQVDVYGCGVVLFELLTGVPAFAAASNVDLMITIVRSGLDLDRLLRAGVPAPLVDVVAQATASAPEQRFDSAGAFLRALEQALEHMGAFVSPTRLAEALQRANLFG